MKTVLFGLLLGLLATFPHLAVPLVDVGRVLAAQPLLWAFCAGAVTGPRILRRLPRRLP